MSQEDLAGAAQIDRSYVSLVENEHFSISIDQIQKIAEALGVEIEEMFRASRKDQLNVADRR